MAAYLTMLDFDTELLAAVVSDALERMPSPYS